MTHLVVLLLFLSIMDQVASDNNGVVINYPPDNQVLFRERGVVINQATFLHMKYELNMTDTVVKMAEFLSKLNATYHRELQTANTSSYGFLMEGKPDIQSVFTEGEVNELYRKRSTDGAAICQWLYAMFDFRYKELKEALTYVPDMYQSGNPDLNHNRGKRFIGMVTGVTGVMMATSNGKRISHVEKEMDSMSKKYNVLVDNTQQISDQVKQIFIDVKILRNMMDMLDHRNYHKIITASLVANDNLRSSINVVRDIIISGRQRRPSPGLLNGENLVQAYRTATDKAKELGCRMIIDSPTDLYEIETSYAYEDEGYVFAIYLHVPLVEQNELLKLLEYVPFPIVQSFSTNSTIIPKTNDHKFIAIVPLDITGGTKDSVTPYKFRTMTEVDLFSCQKIRNVHICGGRNTLKSDVSSSCIAGLWLRDQNIISNVCDMEIEAPQEYVAKMDVNRWMISIPSPITRNVVCGANVIDTIRIQDQTDLTLPAGCEVRLKSHILSTDNNVNVDFKIKVYNWKIDGSLFDTFLDPKDNLGAMIQELITTRSKFGLKDLSHLKHYYTYSTDQLSAIWEYLSTFSLFSWLNSVYTIVTIVPLIILIYCGFKCGVFSMIWNRCTSTRSSRMSERENQHRRRSVSRQSRRNVIVENEVGIPMLQVVPSASAPVLENEIVSFENETYKGRDVNARPVKSQCNPGRMEGNIEDFVCDHHVEKGQAGHCMGTWLKRS